MSNLKKTIKKPQTPIPDSETKKSGKWTEEEDVLLQQVVPLYNERHWRKISQHMKGRSAIQCLHRWTKILKPGLVKGPWSSEEDNRLMVWVQEKGPIKWAQCALLIPGRSGKQCRERWFNNLNPNVKKGDWNPEEDDLIFKLYVNYGSSWSKIAMHFKDRTENSIKNRFYSTIRKLYSDQKKLEKGKTVKKHLKKQVDNDDIMGETAKNEEVSKENNSKESSKEKENNSNEIISKENAKEISKENNTKENNTKENNSKENKTKENNTKENNTKENTKENSKNSNKNLINTLYDLLKTSNIEHAPHINKIYASGIYKKSRRYRRKPKKNIEITEKPQEESMKSITTRVSSNIKDEAYCSESESEDGNFENFLSSIENTINKELILREMDSLKDLSLEELQNKVFDFCNENPINLEVNEERTRTFELENILNQQIEKEIIDGSKNPDKILEKAVHEEIMKCDEQSFESDKKMFFLVQQLQTLENMLTKTRQELISLENSLQIPEKNCSLQGENACLKEEDSFVNNFNFFNENLNLPNISEWNCKRKASLSLDDFFDFPGEGVKKQKRFNFMEEELGNDNLLNFKEE